MLETSTAPGPETPADPADATSESVGGARRYGFTLVDNRLVDGYLPSAGAMPFAVLVVLRRHADKTGRCHPSIRRIAKIVHSSQPTVLKAIAALEKDGYIKVERKRTKGGKREVNVYTLLPLGGAQVASTPALKDVEHRAKGG